MTKEETARRALNKRADKMQIPDRAEWAGDKHDDKTYTWTYFLDGTKTEMVYGYANKTITVVSQ